MVRRTSRFHMNHISKHFLVEICVVEDFCITLLRCPFDGRAKAYITLGIKT